MTPDEIDRLLTDLHSLVEQQIRIADEKIAADRKSLTTVNERIETEKRTSAELATNFKNRLGVEEAINPELKRVLANRSEIESRIIEEAKRKFGEEKFVESQRNKFFREQLDKFSEGTNAYGSVVTRFKDLDNQQQQRLIDAARTQQLLKTEQEKFTKTVQSLANPSSAMKEMSDKFSSFSSVVDTGKDSLIKLAGGGTGVTIAFELMGGVVKVFSSALSGAVTAALTMGKALIAGERGLSVGAKGVTDFTKSITGAVKGLSDLAIGAGALLFVINPLAGAALIGIGAIGKLASSAAETAAELNALAASVTDKAFEGFNELGKMSMTGARGMAGVVDNLHKMSLTIAEFDKFRTVVSANAKEMNMFGDTAEKGVNRFAEVAGDLYNSGLGKTFELMGISAEAQFEHAAKQMALEARLGTLKEKSAKDQAKSTALYIEELDRLATLTGATRKEQEDAREAIMKIATLRAALVAEQSKPGGGDSKRIKELENTISVASWFQAQQAYSLAKGAAEYHSSRAIQSAESAEYFRVHGGKGGLAEQITSNTGTKTSLITTAIKELGKNLEDYAIPASMIGEMPGMLTNIAALADIMAKGRGTEKYNKALETAKKEEGEKFDISKFEEKYFEDLRKSVDPLTNDMVDLQRTQKATAISLDKAALAYVNIVGINKIASDTFSSAVDTFARIMKWKEEGTLEKEVVGEGSVFDLANKALGGSGTKPTAEMSSIELIEKGKISKPALQARVEGAKAYKEPTFSQKEAEAMRGQGVKVPEELVDKVMLKFGSDSGSKEHFDKLESNFKEKVTNAANEYYNLTGKKLSVTSAKREKEDQQRLYDESVAAGRPGKTKQGRPIAKPGTSQHELGKAIDIGEYNDPTALKILNKHGLYQTVPNDLVHFTGPKARSGAMFSGPDSGFPVELHGRESVWPEQKLQEFVGSVEKQSLDKYQKMLLDNNRAGSSVIDASPISSDVTGLIVSMTEAMTSKLDQVIDKLSDGNYIQDQILKYNMV